MQKRTTRLARKNSVEAANARPVNVRKRKSIVILIVVALLATSLQGFLLTLSGNSPSLSSAGRPAASATQIPLVSNKLGVELPNTKAEAAAFVRQHSSPFNFDTLAKLRQDYALKTGQAPSQNYAAPAASLAPTPTPPSAAVPANVAPANTNGLSYAVPPPATCDPLPVDIREPNNTPLQANTIFVGQQSITQVVSTLANNADPYNNPDSDVDWMGFSARAGTTYFISIPFREEISLRPVLELYRGTVSQTSLVERIISNDEVDFIAYTPTANETLFIRVFATVNESICGGVLRVALTSQVNTPAPPTATATATVETCRDEYEDDGEPTRAKELRVSYTPTPPFGTGTGVPVTNTANTNIQQRFICPIGDQDWVFVELVKGKPYSIFTAGLSNGLDTMVTLFEVRDGTLVPIFSNDDFPGMDLASRIDFVVPAPEGTATGEYVRYYVNIKDVSGRGTSGLAYQLSLTSPGAGKSDCIDQYEGDGLPNLAKEILLRETQIHVLCPDGDADWIKFFARAGRNYQIATNFPDTTPGLETYLFVFAITFDPNDPTAITSQAQLASSLEQQTGTTPQAAVTFSVPQDGIYYAQVKNTGDVGRPGFLYQLSYQIAGTSTPPTPTPTVAPTTAGTTATPTRTATPSPTTGSTSTALNQNFSDPAFRERWMYSDLPVAQNQTQRTWEWGPAPGAAKQEPYSEAPGGSRQVQYFDKSRMEINNPKADRTADWFVSNGLLVREMVTGRMAKGDNLYEQRTPANIPVAGDLTSNNAPTYARFASLITVDSNNRATNQTGQVVKQGIARDGSIWTVNTPPEAIKNVAYISETGHNIPQVFYDFMLSKGTVYTANGFKQAPLRDWVYTMGYPVTEPYWIKATVGGVEKDVLVQLFERRILTYTPSNSPDWRVEMANVGQHYYNWRYGQ
jgi:hypothetical protein